MSRRDPYTPSERARLDAESQHRQLEAERGGHEVDAPQPQAADPEAPLYVGHACRDHPSKRVDPPTGECLLCKLNPVRRELRAPLFDEASALPTKPRLI